LEKYVPKQCREILDAEGEVLKAATHDGFILLNMPSFDARCELGETLAALVRGIPEDIVGLRRARESVKLASKRVVEVSIKRLKDGKEYKSFDDLCNDPSCMNMITEVTAAILVGTEEGNG
jgi:hypothetical protein